MYKGHLLAGKRRNMEDKQIKQKSQESASQVERLLSDSFALYKPPFRYDSTYIWDAKHEMVMNVNETSESELVLRGWGRVGGMENAEALHDEVGKHIAKALTEYWEKGLGR